MKLKILMALAIILTISCSKQPDIAVNDAWVRSAPANTKVLAVFMHIKNSTSKTIGLIKAEADGYAKVELHRTQMQDGMMKMARQDSIPVPANSKVMLEPGSWHIMLIKPEKVPAAGETVMLNLHFDNNTQIKVEAMVKADNNAGHMNHNH